MYIKNESDIKKKLNQFDERKKFLVLSSEKSESLCKKVLAYLDDNGHKYLGGMFPSIIANFKNHEHGVVLAPISTDWEPVIFEDLSKDKLVNQKFKKLINSHKASTCLTLLDGLSHQSQNFLNKLYSHLGPNFRYLGGGAGSLSLKPTPCIFTNNGFYSNAAVILLTEEKWSIGVQHGWQPISEPMVATEVSGNTIKKINWRPAIEVYQEKISTLTNEKISIENFFSIAKNFPFGILKEFDDCVVRDPIILNEDGSITCVGKISKGSSIQILTAENEQLIKAAQKASQEVLDEVQRPEVSIIIDCISRGIFLGPQIQEELNTANRNQNHYSIGALTLGEIASSKNGILELYNKTFVYGAA